MLPMMLGVVLASVASGQLISRTGRYKLYPVLGGALSATGMWLLSRLTAGTPRAEYSVYMGVLGLGVGMVLPVLVLAVQNSAAPRDLGAATSANNYFRQVGGSVGAAVFGTLFAHRLTERLAVLLPRAIGGAARGGAAPPDPQSITPQLVHRLPAPIGSAYVTAYAQAMPRIFLYLVPVLLVGFLLAFLLKEKPLVTQYGTGPAPAPGGIGARPENPDAAPAAPVVPSVPAARATPAPAAAATTPAAVRHAGGAAVRGTVRHPDGSGVGRAALTLIDTAGRQVARGATAEDGGFTLAAPGSGGYVLIAAAGGHQPSAVSVTLTDRPVELDVVLGGAGRLAGTVRTADGSPVPGAVVTLTDIRGDVLGSTRSGADGGYALRDLVAGEYTLAASAPAFRPAALPVSVQPARETRQDVELAGGAVLRGTVRAPGGRPVEDARVTLLDAGGTVLASMATGADGGFRFTDLQAGEYTVIAAGYPPVATVLTVAGGERAERDLQLGHGD
jgi:hypothetical protein